MSWIVAILMVQAAVSVNAGAHGEDKCMPLLMQMMGDPPKRADGEACLDMGRRLGAHTGGGAGDQAAGAAMMVGLCQDSGCKQFFKDLAVNCEGSPMIPAEDMEGLKGLTAVCDDSCGMAFLTLAGGGCDVAGPKICDSNADCKTKFCSVKNACSSDVMPPIQGMTPAQWKTSMDAAMAEEAKCKLCPATDAGSAMSTYKTAGAFWVTLLAAFAFA